MLTGGAVLVGWLLGVGGVKSVIPGAVSMKANTALGFVLAGLALAIDPRGPRSRAVVRFLAGTVGLLGTVTLAQYLFGVDLGIDQLLFREPPGQVGTLAPNRMAPTSAVSFLLFGLSLWLSTSTHTVAASQAIACFVGILGFLSVAGYALGATDLIGIGRYTQMAIHTAFLFLVLSAGVLLLHSGEGYVQVVSGGTPGGWLLRRALVILLGAPLLVGWIGVVGVTRGHWNAQFGIALVVVAVAILLAGVMYWAAYRLSLVERAWKEAERSRDEMRAKLERSARLASLGTLVAGVAHEVNNPLTVETSGQGVALEMARELRARLAEGADVDRAEEIRLLDDAIEALEDAQGGGRRIADIVRDLSALARPQGVRTRVTLSNVVTSALDWVQAPVRDLATVEVVDRGAPPLMASASQLSQVVVNLVTNAAKATPRGERGRVMVRIGTAPSGAARLEVQDHGVGIAPSILDRIFDPFFTTRPAGEGRGTGLGLAICHAIVTDHGGTLTVESEVGKGSTFRVELPTDPARVGPAASLAVTADEV